MKYETMQLKLVLWYVYMHMWLFLDGFAINLRLCTQVLGWIKFFPGKDCVYYAYTMCDRPKSTEHNARLLHH